MTFTHGMDLQAVEELGRFLQAKADVLRGLAGDLNGTIHSTGWLGDDEGLFRQQQWPNHRARLGTMADEIHGFGQSALNNATEQREASNAGSTAAASAAVATAAAGLPAGWAGMTSNQRIQALSRMSWKDAELAWASLSDAERRQIAKDGVGYGNMDFVPPVVRYAINREAMTEEYLRLLALDASDKTGDEIARERLYYRLLTEHQQVLLFDPSGDGKIGVVHGDLTRATELAVQVPGIDNKLGNYGGMLDASQRLHGAAGSEGVAVISWLGYDTPGNATSFEMGSQMFADAGATSLKGLVTSLDEGNPNARITVIGHSYGSLVTGMAASNGMPADQIVLVGSPGAGVDSVDAFVRPDGTRPQVYVGENASDYVSSGSDLIHPDGARGWHGVNPSNDAFKADDVQRFYGVTDGHNYYNADSDQLRWLGERITPRQDLSQANLA